MPGIRLFAIAGAVATLGVVACDGGSEVADIPFAEVRKAMDGDGDAFGTYFGGIKGKAVRWQGTVVASIREHGDDYIEIGTLKVDFDGDGTGADATMEIKPSQIDTFKPGQAVAVVAVIREFARTPQGLMLKLDPRTFE